VTPALYELQADCNGWFHLSYWQMEPRYFRDFLTYFFSWPSHCDAGSINLLRIKRVPYEWGKAAWEFDGERHCSTCY
jgi:hypothetical protein